MTSQIKFYRKMKGWSQYHVEKHTGINQTVISLYERDIRLPNPTHLTALCTAFDVTPNQLYPTQKVSEKEKERKPDFDKGTF